MALRKLTLLAAPLLLMSCAQAEPLAVPAPPAPQSTVIDLSLWIAQTEQLAIDNGVSPTTVHAALDNFTPNPRVVELDRKQPEGTITFETYRHNVITPARVKKGAELMERYADQLAVIEQRTGVPPQIVVALWGIESSFGANMGGFETVNSLATLAYEGRRTAFFRTELIAALHIIDQQHMAVGDLRGSWAGAMGQSQFMPSTYLNHAVDGDGDGKIDIWNDPADVMASIAGYLASEGWNRDLTWGREVVATDIPANEIGLTQTYSLAEWAAKGVTAADGSPLPRRDVQASLVQPDGSAGANFLVYDNIRAVMRWNRSSYFALSVGLFADQIKGF